MGVDFAEDEFFAEFFDGALFGCVRVRHDARSDVSADVAVSGRSRRRRLPRGVLLAGTEPSVLTLKSVIAEVRTAGRLAEAFFFGVFDLRFFFGS